MNLSRRRLLGIGAVCVGLAGSGCLGENSDDDRDTSDDGSDSDDSSDGDNDGDVTGSTSSADGDDSASDAPGEEDDATGAADTTPTDLGLDHGAEYAAFEYLKAIDVGDVDAANAVLHPESPLWLDDGDIQEPGVSIDELELATVEEAVAGEFGLEGDDLADATAETKAELEAFLDEIDADEYAYVWGSFTSAQYGDEDGYLLVVRDGDEWLIHGE